MVTEGAATVLWEGYADNLETLLVSAVSALEELLSNPQNSAAFRLYDVNSIELTALPRDGCDVVLKAHKGLGSPSNLRSGNGGGGNKSVVAVAPATTVQTATKSRIGNDNARARLLNLLCFKNF